MGLERAGMETVAFCEIEKYPRAVLKKHWPNVPIFEDVRKITENEIKKIAPVDVITGGFPCQDLSQAGKQKGLINEKGEQTRSGLFFEIIRIARMARPRYIIMENVRGLLVRPEWMGTVLREISSIGYDAEWQIIQAGANPARRYVPNVGAPHRRARIWIVAYPTFEKYNEQSRQDNPQRQIISRRKNKIRVKPSGCGEIMAKTEKIRRTKDINMGGNRIQYEDRQKKFEKRSGEKFIMADTKKKRIQGNRSNREQKPQIQIKKGISGCNSTGSRAKKWPTEPNVGRVAHGIPSWTHRIEALGNAIVPQIAEMIGRRIMEIEALFSNF